MCVPAYLLEVSPGQGHCQGLMVVAYGGDMGFAEKGADLTFTAFSLYAFSVSPLHVFFSLKITTFFKDHKKAFKKRHIKEM